jgi:hypothetical protein
MVIGGSRFGHVWPSTRVTAIHLEGQLDLGGTPPGMTEPAPAK